MLIGIVPLGTCTVMAVVLGVLEELRDPRLGPEAEELNTGLARSIASRAAESSTSERASGLARALASSAEPPSESVHERLEEFLERYPPAKSMPTTASSVHERLAEKSLERPARNPEREEEEFYEMARLAMRVEREAGQFEESWRLVCREMGREARELAERYRNALFSGGGYDHLSSAEKMANLYALLEAMERAKLGC